MMSSETETIITPPSGEANEADKTKKLVEQKYATCWGMAVDRFGANVHAMAEFLYYSLYNPGYFVQHAEEFHDERFPDRVDLLSAELPEPATVPSQKEFIESVRNSATREVDVQQCLYPQSIEQIRTLMHEGQVVIWTTGDSQDQAEHPHSFGQLKKVFGAGLNDERHAVAAETGKTLSEALTVIAANDKLAPEAIAQAKRLAEGKNSFVVDDRLSNLVGFQHAIPDALPIWVQQGKHGQKVPSDLENVQMPDLHQHFNAVTNIAELSDTVAVLQPDNGKQNVFFVDFDGTICDDTQRAKLQKQAVIRNLQNNGWI